MGGPGGSRDVGPDVVTKHVDLVEQRLFEIGLLARVVTPHDHSQCEDHDRDDRKRRGGRRSADYQQQCR